MMSGPTLFDSVTTCPEVREFGHHRPRVTPDGPDSEMFRCYGSGATVCVGCGLVEVDEGLSECDTCAKSGAIAYEVYREQERLGLFESEWDGLRDSPAGPSMRRPLRHVLRRSAGSGESGDGPR